MTKKKKEKEGFIRGVFSLIKKGGAAIEEYQRKSLDVQQRRGETRTINSL